MRHSADPDKLLKIFGNKLRAVDCEFVAHMEDTLEAYHGQYNEKFPMVCLDETNRQLIAETRKAIPVKSGRVKRIDCEYRRNSTSLKIERVAHIKVVIRLKSKKDVHKGYLPVIINAFWNCLQRS